MRAVCSWVCQEPLLLNAVGDPRLTTPLLWTEIHGPPEGFDRM